MIDPREAPLVELLNEATKEYLDILLGRANGSKEECLEAIKEARAELGWMWMGGRHG